MTLHLPAPVLTRLAALASLDAQSEPHTEEVYAGLIAASAAFLAASNTLDAELTIVPVGIVWDERLVAVANDPDSLVCTCWDIPRSDCCYCGANDRVEALQREKVYSSDPDGGLAR